MIPVARIREALTAAREYFGQSLPYSGDTDAIAAQERFRPFLSLADALPASGVVLSAEEVAQVRGAIIFAEAKAEGLTKTRAAIVEALALLDSADEEETK